MNRWGWQVVLRAIVGVALTGLAAAGQGETPPPNPVVEHYKAYTAALQRQDFATAETEAAAALEASVQAYGDEGRTAVLALNLADVRLVRGNLDAAVAPAQKALALAEARGSASGVDARLARLTLDRAQLRSGGPFALDRLEKSVNEAVDVPALAALAYPGAVELALYAGEKRAYGMAGNAWATVVRILRAQANPNRLLIARALLGEASAGIIELSNGPTSDAAGFRKLGYKIVEAMDLTAPEARKPGPTTDLTAPQTLYAQGIAWRTVITAKLASENRRPRLAPELKDPIVEIGGERHGSALCEARVVTPRRPDFPHEERVDGHVGTVVLKLRADETGALEHWAIAATVGGPAFARAVEAVVPTWRLEKEAGAPSDCRMAREFFTAVSYRYR